MRNSGELSSEEKERRLDVVTKLQIIPMRERKTKMGMIGTSDNYDNWYGNLINEWIPSQPDAAELMHLFILCEFDPLPFLKIVNAMKDGN